MEIASEIVFGLVFYGIAIMLSLTVVVRALRFKRPLLHILVFLYAGFSLIITIVITCRMMGTVHDLDEALNVALLGLFCQQSFAVTFIALLIFSYIRNFKLHSLAVVMLFVSVLAMASFSYARFETRLPHDGPPY